MRVALILRPVAVLSDNLLRMRGCAKVAVITGDDLMPKLDQVLESEPAEMFTCEPTPPREAIASANAYLGAFPIAEALNQGADIVVTGRCVDSAVTLGACIHRFGWQRDDLDLLAAGSLAGHLIECGPQATGGSYTDWHEVADSLHDGIPHCRDCCRRCGRDDQTTGHGWLCDDRYSR